MASKTVNSTAFPGVGPTRRELLCRGMGLAALSLCPARLVAQVAGATNPTTTQPATTQPAGARTVPWWLGPEHPRSRVVIARADNALNGTVPSQPVVEDLIGSGVQALTAKTSPDQAWDMVLQGAQRIAVKFDPAGGGVTGTSEVVARGLVQHLNEAGYHPRTLTLVGLPEHVGKALGTRPVERGWGEPIAVGADQVQVANWVYAADAIINLPTLAAGPVGGVWACLRNLGYGILRHPAKYYTGSGPADVARALATEPILKRWRLNLVDALRVVLRSGADAISSEIREYGGFVIGFDPIAAESASGDILMRERRAAEMSPEVENAFLAAGIEAGLGRRRVDEIEPVLIGPKRYP